ncbi:hypothetical protein LEP1GSC024_1706 [Leptospira noguchii str. 2001034031]|uniref:Uncharacterized protein n=1 Tax=Leptospira noguchii str. 2001034031 TaxID=1193053 RepID=M6Y5T3_9LEPT|nr:hypothetical protein LEP1GSC024_1706 [Leptospira noguchii str. 2001034031]
MCLSFLKDFTFSGTTNYRIYFKGISIKSKKNIAQSNFYIKSQF